MMCKRKTRIGAQIPHFLVQQLSATGGICSLSLLMAISLM